MTYTNKGYTETEIIEALHMIQNICEEYNECENCPFAGRYEVCKLQDTSPSSWEIRKTEVTWRAFE